MVELGWLAGMGSKPSLMCRKEYLLISYRPRNVQLASTLAL
jgi:hypothetical protein